MKKEWVLLNGVFIRASEIVAIKRTELTIEILTKYICVNETYDDRELAEDEWESIRAEVGID